MPKHKLPTKNGEAEPQMTKIMIFGNANQCEVAQRMIQEAIENKVSLRDVECHEFPFSCCRSMRCLALT